MRVSPGLSSFAADPARAGESLWPLIEFAREKIGSAGDAAAETEVRLMATAGLRLLEEHAQEAILASCREVLRASGFRFEDAWAKPLMKANWLLNIVSSSNGSWRSIWTMEFNYELQFVDIKGKIQVDAHYFEEGNVQLDNNIDLKDSRIMQLPDDSAVSIASIIRHHESEYLSSLEESYLNLSDATFKDLRRKLPVTRTLFPWHNTLAFSLTRDLAKELALGK